MNRKRILVGAIICVSTVAGLYAVVSSRTFQFFGDIINRVNTNEKVVAITFDDGPSPYTTELLAILQQYQVRATFFLIGGELENNMQYGKMLAAAGQEIGNHSFTHNRLILSSGSTIKSEIEKTDALIRETGYTGEILFRPPGCKKLFTLPHYLSEHNRKTITWDIEPESDKSIGRDASKITDDVLAKARSGSIILLHAMTSGNIESRKALPAIIAGLQQKGYKFITMSELLNYQKG